MGNEIEGIKESLEIIKKTLSQHNELFKKLTVRFDEIEDYILSYNKINTEQINVNADTMEALIRNQKSFSEISENHSIAIDKHAEMIEEITKRLK
jgi:hypothetical protein